ncbi:hypothetical protein ONZ45_g12492 [Pleurotus djamor]|nr:hypothetical protein ONZ45_g12492 [Pleurotus djamor]
MPSTAEHYLCQPVMYRKNIQVPAAEVEPPFYLAYFGKMANIYTEQDKDRVLTIVRKGGHKVAYSSYNEVVAAFESFCRRYHPDDVHMCITAHYRVPLHRVLHYFRGTESHNLDSLTMMILPNLSGDDSTEESESEDMDVEGNRTPNSPTILDRDS